MVHCVVTLRGLHFVDNFFGNALQCSNGLVTPERIRIRNKVRKDFDLLLQNKILSSGIPNPYPRPNPDGPCDAVPNLTATEPDEKVYSRISDIQYRSIVYLDFTMFCIARLDEDHELTTSVMPSPTTGVEALCFPANHLSSVLRLTSDA